MTDGRGSSAHRSVGLHVSDLTVNLAGHPVLIGVDLEVTPGTVTAVLGRSGSGKSTLLRAIAGLIPVDSGRIELDGADLNARPVHRRDIGLMFQDHALFGHLSVADNIGYGLRARAVPRAKRRPRVDELLDLVGLSGFGGRSIATLSGGEAQRVALARALAPHPRLLLLDEPLASLDRPRRADLLAHLASVMATFDRPAVYVTHDRDEAFAIADAVVVLDHGRVVRAGTPEALWSDPQHRIVAELLGHPNIVSGESLRRVGLDVDPDREYVVPTTAVRLVTRNTPGALSARVLHRVVAGDMDLVTISIDDAAELRIHAPRTGLHQDLSLMIDATAVEMLQP